jgi:2-polyprenyl-3-methyl-5-hydroxy-6-metoxy-1,4-benzoquinol methylase
MMRRAGLTELRERLHKKTHQRTYWDRRVSEEPDTVRSCDYMDDRSFRLTRREIVDCLRTVRGRKMLDLGCGPGLFSEPLVKQGYGVIGVDFSRGMLEQAQARLRGVIQADVRALPFRAGIFDVAVCVGVLQYLASWRTLPSELFERLRPGGVAILATLNPSFLPYVVFQKKLAFNHTLHREAPVRQALDRAGFRDIKTIWISYVFGGRKGRDGPLMRFFTRLTAHHYAVMGYRPSASGCGLP